LDNEIDRASLDFLSDLCRNSRTLVYLVCDTKHEATSVVGQFAGIRTITLSCSDAQTQEDVLEIWLDKLWWACWDAREAQKGVRAVSDIGEIFKHVIDEVVQNPNVAEWPAEDVRRKDLVLLYSYLCRVIESGRVFHSSFGSVTKLPSKKIVMAFETMNKDIRQFGALLLNINLHLLDVYDPGIALMIRRSIGMDSVMSYVVLDALGHTPRQDGPALDRAAALISDYYKGDGYWRPELYISAIRESLSEHLGNDRPLLHKEILAGVGAMLDSLESVKHRLADFLRSHWSLADHGIPDASEYTLDQGYLELNEKKFKTCFLSFSFKDKDFALIIYRDLQNAGVGVYYAPHDAEPGKFLIDVEYPQP
jgi:hypothetical protein